MTMGGLLLFAGVALLTLAAPFELTEPIVRLPAQSVTSLETAVLAAFAVWAFVVVRTRRLPEWRTPLTLPWIALLAALAVASLASPVSRLNALHMTGRLTAAFGIYLLTVNGVTTRARLRFVLALAVGVGLVVSVLAVLEYLGVAPVVAWLKAFRPDVFTVGAHVRAGGPLQYPTIASMYLEIVFAFGLGVLLAQVDARRWIAVAAIFAALVVVSGGIVVTFTRAGLVTMAVSLALALTMRVGARGADRGARLVGALAVVVAVLLVSSRSSDSLWLRLTTESQGSWYRAAIAAPPDVDLSSGRLALVPLAITNTGRLAWDSSADPPIVLSYHWLPADSDRFVSFEGARTEFADRVEPGATAVVNARVVAPRQPGQYRIEWDLVQEGRLWFSTEPGASRRMSRAAVAGAAAGGAAETFPPPKRTVRPGRLELWRAAARIVAAHPLLGIGPDNFRLAYGSYAGIASPDTRTHSNNMYLEVLTGGGLLAGAAFAWLLWRAAVCVGTALSGALHGATAAIGVGAAALAIALHAIVDSFLGFAPTYVLFSLTLGCAVACARGVESGLDAHRV